ncbi:hypothetical protein GJ659_010760 [Streptomyces sp. S-2]|nr:hypothetical protein [Streptomyces sp. S-2]
MAWLSSSQTQLSSITSMVCRNSRRAFSGIAEAVRTHRSASERSSALVGTGPAEGCSTGMKSRSRSVQSLAPAKFRVRPKTAG